MTAAMPVARPCCREFAGACDALVARPVEDEAAERLDGYQAGSRAGFEDRIVALATRGAR